MPLLSERAGHDCTGEPKVLCKGSCKSSEALWGAGGVGLEALGIVFGGLGIRV